MQEAHAVPTLTAYTGTSASGDSTDRTKIFVNLGVASYSTGTGGAIAASISVSNAGGLSISSVTTLEADDSIALSCTSGGTSSFTITLSGNLDTDATPTVTYDSSGGTNPQIKQCSDDSTLSDSSSDVADDGLRPVVSSAATTSSTTIVLTMSEDVSNVDAVAGDFTIGGVASSPTVSNLAVSGTSITLTLNAAIVESDSPTVTYTLNGRSIDDGAEDNDLAAFSNQSVTNNVTAPTESNGGGSGCNGDCEEPTLGVLPNGQRIVEDGFTYNGYSVDVERFFTPYPLITAQVGKQNTAQFKIYENRGPDNIAHFSFAFGLGKGEIISQSQAMIEVDFTRDRTQTVTITDPENALDNVLVTTDKVTCNGGQTQCLEITIKHMFREPLDFDIVGTDVWDYSRQSWQNYYNHGIEVVGPSMNPPDEFDGIDKGHIYHLTETSKTTAVDEFGDSWTFQYGTWNKDFIKQERIQDGEKMVFDRMHSDFADYKNTQAEFAFSELLEFCPLCIETYDDFEESFSYSYPNGMHKLDDPEIQNKMKFEINKAEKIMDELLDPYYHYRDQLR